MPTWTTNQLSAAIDKWRSGQSTAPKATYEGVGLEYGIPVRTLKRYLNGQTIGAKSGPPRALTEAEEQGLVDGLIDLHRKGYPATRLHLKGMVIDIVSDGRKHSFDLRGPTDKWVRRFLLRHEDRLSARKSRILDASRVNSFDGDEIKCFFAEYRAFMLSNPIPATQIYNCDETGVDPQGGGSPAKVLAQRGAKHVPIKAESRKHFCAPRYQRSRWHGSAAFYL
jgi:hypothetical protein